MKTFYLGYATPDAEELTNYETCQEAAFNSEEWIRVTAETLEEALELYEDTYNTWKERQDVDIAFKTFLEK